MAKFKKPAPLDVKCTSADCENELHCFKQLRKMSDEERGKCRYCGADLVDWDRLRGTVTLFAALSYLDGKIFSRTAAKHTHRRWLDILRHLNRETPRDLSLHLIADNHATHKHPKVQSWIRWRNRRFRKTHGIDRVVMHFTPTSSWWMNLVERFFRDLTQDAIRSGSFTSVAELVKAITGHLEERNLNPKTVRLETEGTRHPGQDPTRSTGSREYT